MSFPTPTNRITPAPRPSPRAATLCRVAPLHRLAANDPRYGVMGAAPIGLAGGSNLYRYADADPVNVYDNTGECGLIGAARNVALGLLLSGGCFSWGDALTDAAR